MEWARILAYITGTVDQELLLRNEYLAAENRILRGQLKGRLKLSDAGRAKLGEIGRRLGRKALGEVTTAALPDTILAWYRRLVARKFDGSKHRSPGRPRVDKTIEGLIVRMAEENRSWGYDRIVASKRRCWMTSCSRSTRRTTSSGSTSTAKSGMFSTSSLMRASNFTVPTTPTLRPKLRKVPRRSLSIAMAFDCSSLRWVSSIRSF